MNDEPTEPGIWNYPTLGNPGLVTDPVRPMPLPQFNYEKEENDSGDNTNPS